MTYSTKVITLIVIYLFAFVYCLGYAPKIENIHDNSLNGKLNSVHKSCIINCKCDLCKHSVRHRGDGYFINTPSDEQEGIKNCFLTFWGFTHFFLNMFIGFLLPSMFIESFIVGVSFEYYEYVYYKCHDPLDIVLNTLGFIAGYLLSPYKTFNMTKKKRMKKK